MYVGTRSADGDPDSVLAFGLRASPDATEITVFVAAAIAGGVLAHLRDNGQIAIAVTSPPTHRAMQLKGTWIGERRATDDDRAFVERYRDKLVRQLGIVGVPRSMARRFLWWPLVALRVQITDVFEQTPGPKAGHVYAAPGRCGDGAA